MTNPRVGRHRMYEVVLVLSITLWAFAITMLVSKPSDVRRTVRLLRDSKASSTAQSPAEGALERV